MKPFRFLRMRIDSSGDVSIGRSAGNARLDVYGTITTTLGNSNLLNVGSGAGQAGYYHTIELSPTINGYTIAPSAIGYLTEQSTDGTYGHLVFATRNVTTDTAPSERMRIASSGQMGLGTNNPCAAIWNWTAHSQCWWSNKNKTY